MRAHARPWPVGAAVGRVASVRARASPSRRDLLLAGTVSVGLADNACAAGVVDGGAGAAAAVVDAAPPPAVEAAAGVVAAPDARTFR